MSRFRFEADNVDAACEAVEHFCRFHDDYVHRVEIQFEDYKALNEQGESTGVRDAHKTLILTVNSRPYGRDHGHLVRVEFQDAQSFDIASPQDPGPCWCIGTTNIVPDGDFIRWEFDFVCGHAKFTVTCARLVIKSDFVRREG